MSPNQWYSNWQVTHVPLNNHLPTDIRETLIKLSRSHTKRRHEIRGGLIGKIRVLGWRKGGEGKEVRVEIFITHMMCKTVQEH